MAHHLNQILAVISANALWDLGRYVCRTLTAGRRRSRREAAEARAARARYGLTDKRFADE